MTFLPLPTKVYKYRTAQSALEILDRQSIYLPSVSRFNDPFDCKIPVDFTSLADDEKLQRKFIEMFLIDPNVPPKDKSEKIDRVISSGRTKDKEILRAMEAARLRKMEDMFAVFCLSEISDNLIDVGAL